MGFPSGSPLSLLADFPVPADAAWREVVERELGGAEYDRVLRWKTIEGLTLEPIYTAEQVPAGRSTAVAGASAGWRVEQECRLPSPGDASAALREGLAHGEGGIRLVLDWAAQRCLDAGSEQAGAAVGDGGCSITSLGDLRLALDGIDLAAQPISIEAGAAGAPVLALLIALAGERETEMSRLSGCVGGDPAAQLLRDGSLPFAADSLAAAEGAAAAWATVHAPNLRTVFVNGEVFHESGASVVEELAYMLAGAAGRLRTLIASGMSADEAASAFAVRMAVSPRLLLEVAKLRAARIVWSKMTAAFGATTAEAQRMRLHVSTGRRDLAAADYHCNLARTSIEAFIASVGGCDSLSVRPFEAPLGAPSELGARLARNQQLLLIEEAYLSRVADPLAGSYAVEAATDSVARAAWALIQEVDASGGLIAGLRSGVVQRRIGETARRRHEALNTGREKLVGVTHFVDASAPLPEGRARAELGTGLREERESSRVGERLAVIQSARGAARLEAAAASAAASATLAEIAAALLGSAAEGPSVQPLPAQHSSQPFETLRAETGRPEVLLVPFGPPAMRRARADFCANYFAVGGFAVHEAEPAADAAAAAGAILASPAKIAVLCSDDASYPVVASAICQAVRRQRGGVQIVVAGNPAEHLAALQSAGVDAFVHLRAPLIETLQALRDRALAAEAVR